MPLFAAAMIPFWTAAAGAGVAATADIIGAHEESSGATNAANITSTAVQHGADLQAKAAADALAFQKQQAENDQRNYQSTQMANYGQYLNKYARMAPIAAMGQGAYNKLGGLLGVDPAQMPAPPPPPQFTPFNFTGQTPPNTTQPVPGAPPQPGPGNSSTGNIPNLVTAELAKYGIQPGPRGSGVGDVAYWADQINANGGWNNYWPGRIQQEIQRAGGPGQAQAAAAPPANNAPNVLAAQAAQNQQQANAFQAVQPPNLAMPQYASYRVM